MFGGIVETIGTITHLTINDGCKSFVISPQINLDDLSIGDSIAVNGVCLTVTEFSDQSFNVTAVPETLRLTNLDQLSVSDPVNLERSMKLTSRIGGHYVQGHVDGMGKILDIKNDNSSALLVKISIPPRFSKYLINKGYIAIDGMSITIIDATSDWFTVTFIPHTQAVTTVNRYQIGAIVNLEIDMMSKHIEKLLGAYSHANTN